MKAYLYCSVAGLLLAGEGPALAQSAPASAPGPNTATAQGANEIVVTANKREEKLNNVGLSITALSGDALAERKITSLQDVASAIPGLAYAQSATNTPILTLRGVGFNESSLGVYPAVSVYVDQAPLPFPVLASHSAFDLQRIEVLKGPQGTLFGQNSTGGAINYIAAKPTRSFTAGGDISYGRFNEIDGDAYLSGPITENLRARIAVSGTHTDDWQRSSSRPYDTNGKVSYITGRAIVDWDASDSVRFSLSLNTWRDTSDPQASQYIALRGQNPFVQQSSIDYPFSPQNPRAADWSTGISTPRSDRKFYQPALRADIDLTDAITLTSLTSYGHYTQRQTTDGDGMALAQGDLVRDDGRITTFNQEVRLANSSKSAFRWVLGANYERSRTYENQFLNFADSSQNNAGANFIDAGGVYNRQRIRNYAIFGNAEYDLTSRLTLKGAVRYTNSHNHALTCTYDGGDGRVAQLLNLLGSLLGTVPFTPIGINDCYALNQNNVPGTPYIGQLNQHNVSWRAGVDYHVGPTSLLYANVSRGYKAGSFPVLATASQSSLNPVTQEQLTAYEAGAKLGLWDRKVQLNLAGFYYDYRNKQVRGKINDPLFSVLDLLDNVPKSRVLGFDGDVTINPLPGLSLTGSLTYLDSKVQRYSGYNAIGEVNNFAGDRLPFTSKWNVGLNADYKARLDNGGAPFIGITMNARSSQDAVIGGDRIVIPPSPVNKVLPGLIHPFEMKGYATFDARVGYEAPDGRWTVSLWGKNIFNKYYFTSVITFDDSISRFAARPATYGVTLGFKFD
ncbi:TonB-dependent receptor [Sphingobium herbicidovorans]